MANQIENEIKVGIFVTLGVALLLTTILILGGFKNLFTHKATYTSHLQSAEGLIPGAKVILAGVPVGVVEKIQFDKAQKNIEVILSVSKDATEWIHQGASFEISTQGVLGDKYVNLDGGKMEDPLLPPKSEILQRPSKDISQFLNKSDHLIVTLNGVLASLDRILKSFETDHRSETFFKSLAQSAKNISSTSEKLNDELNQIKLKGAISHLNQIMEKINNGTGTIGALINDASLYDDLKSLLGGVNRNRIMRNLVRQTLKDAKTKEQTQ
jgi:phospholipid/cholesterol/gamma-HCH transport system substrate-binding protein